MAKTDTIRGLRRGLEVLQALQANSILSLHEIYLATGISKPSLLRILHTLEEFGMVSRRLADGHYRISTVANAPRASATVTIGLPKRQLRSSIGCVRRYRGRPTCSCLPAITWSGGRPADCKHPISVIRAI